MGYSTCLKLFGCLVLPALLFSSCTPEPVSAPAFSEVDTTVIGISYGTVPAQQVDLHLPGGRTDTTPVIILIHGGGWTEGSKSDLSFFANEFKKKGFAVANMNYRLSPQSDDNYKMQLDDIDALKTYLIKNSNKYKYSSSDFYIIGHSAGAHLSLSFAYTRNGDHIIKAAAGMATPTNLYNMAYYNPVLYASLLTPYLGAPLSAGTEARYKGASPYYQADANAVPTILFQGDLDVIINKDQAITMSTRLKSLGVDEKLIVYPLVFHDWWTNGDFLNNTIDETCSWFWRHP